jgi:hypothetical protein
MKELIRILFTIFRYPAAVVVAFVASVLTLINLPDLFVTETTNADSPFTNFIWLFCIGLAGVTAGSACLPGKHRWVGSLVLLILGLSFTLFVFGFTGGENSVSCVFFSLASIGVGGIIPAVFFFFWERKRDRIWPKLKHWFSSYP